MHELDAHFVGWLPVPRAFARFLAPVAVGLVVGAGVLAGMLVINQHSPGPGQWDEQASTLEGVVYAEPYAMIRFHGVDGPETVLLVDEGKHGAKERVKPFDGQSVRVSGTVLHRDGRRLLELSPGESGLQSVEMTAARRTALARPTPTPLGRVTLVGEIIDPKCYLGGMKPGAGWTHKGCAALCLRGGVPPMFVFAGADGAPTYHLLTAPDGGPFDPAAFEYVGDRVRVSGRSELWGDLSVLATAPGNIRRASDTSPAR